MYNLSNNSRYNLKTTATPSLILQRAKWSKTRLSALKQNDNVTEHMT